MAHFSNTKKLLGIGAVGAGAGVAGIGAYHVIHTARRQREWREKAKDRDRLKLAHDIYIDKYGAMYPAAHPGMKRAKITELNAKLDYLIEFGEYPMSVVKSVWRKLAAKPKSRYWSSYPQKIIKDQKKKFQPKSSLPTELSSKLDDLIQFAVDPRPRNDLGMFTDQAEGGPDPNAMVRVYHMLPPQQQQSSVGRLIDTGVGAAVGATTGTAATLGIKALSDKLKTARRRLRR